MVQLEAVHRMVENGGNADLTFLNFSKAYDKVDHRILVRKLRKKGLVED